MSGNPRVKRKLYSRRSINLYFLKNNLIVTWDENIRIVVITPLSDLKESGLSQSEKTIFNLYTRTRTKSVREYMLKPDRCYPRPHVKVN